MDADRFSAALTRRLRPIVVIGVLMAPAARVIASMVVVPPGPAVGVLAFGGIACGLVAFGGLAVGVIAIGGGAIGILAFGGGAAGVIAIGGGAVGKYAIGGSGRGLYVCAHFGSGRHCLTRDRQDPAAIEYFRPWLPEVVDAAESSGDDPAS